MNENQELSLQLTLSEINQILDALGSVPYRQIFQLINKIQRQAEGQLQQPQSTNSVAHEVQVVNE